MLQQPQPMFRGDTAVILPAAGRARTTVRVPWLAPRNFAVPLALVLLAVMLTGIALRRDRTALNADVDVVSTGDPMQIGATTQAEVRVRNHSDHEIYPRFSVTWLPYPYYWQVVSGPSRLKPGESATYRIEAPDSTAAPADGQPFQIKVNDAQSITYASSRPIEVPEQHLPIVNPNLRFWTQRDPSTGLISPAGWQMYSHKDDDDVASIEPVDVFGTTAARFHVIQGGNPDPDGWTHTGLVQEIGFPTGPFSVSVLSRAPYKALEGGWPLSAFGIEVGDRKNGLLWLLFQPGGRGDLDYSLPSGHHIHVYDVPPDRWTRVQIDLPAIYGQIGWTRQERVTLKLFIAAASADPDDIEGYIAGISSEAAPGDKSTQDGAATGSR